MEMSNVLTFIVVALAVAQILSEQNGFTLKFKQNDYHITSDRAEVVRYDKQYIRYASITPFKYNRTCTAINATMAINVNFGNRLEMIVQAYKFASNEYRLFPLRFQLNVCDAFAKNIGGIASLKKCGNFSGCPMNKGVIHICKFVVDESQFPPFMLTGQYMGELQLLYLNKEVLVVKVYGAVTRPIV